MSADEITIYRDFAIINGYVQVPPNHEADKTRWTPDEFIAAVTTSEIVGLTPDTMPNNGQSFGRQEFVRVPGQTFDIPL